MFNSLKTTTIRSSKSNNFVFLLLLSVSYIFSSCAYVAKNYPSSTAANKTKILTEREVIFEKGNALMLAQEYDKAEDLFLSLTGQGVQNPDAVYDQSLWNLALIYDKKGYPEKSILLLRQLLTTVHLSQFKVKALLMKNYYRVDNSKEALTYKKMLDAENPKMTIAANALYYDLIETLDFNYDHLLLQELEYLGEVQKYLMFVMEQNDSPKNEKVTELLISIYERAYSLLLKDSVHPEFKRKLSIALLNNLRRFDLLKLNDLNLNLKTVAKFSTYSEKKQKQITDWLHQ